MRTGARLATNKWVPWRGLVGAATGVGSAAVAVMLMLTPVAAGVGTHVLPKNGTPYLSSSKYINGCAAAVAKGPALSLATGIGHFWGSVKTKTCGATKGGIGVNSYADSYGQVGANFPIHFKATSTGVSVSWNLKITASLSAVVTGSTSSCPTTSYSANLNWGYTWYNYSYSYAYCSVMASADVYGYPYLIDTTSNSYYGPGSYWSGMYNNSGAYFSHSQGQANYSNSSYWSSNYSYNYTSTHSYGSPGGFVLSATPTWYFNVSTLGLNVSHKFILTTYVGASLYAGVQHWKGSAAGILNAATLGNHEDLTAVTLY